MGMAVAGTSKGSAGEDLRWQGRGGVQVQVVVSVCQGLGWWPVCTCVLVGRTHSWCAQPWRDQKAQHLACHGVGAFTQAFQVW